MFQEILSKRKIVLIQVVSTFILIIVMGFSEMNISRILFPILSLNLYLKIMTLTNILPFNDFLVIIIVSMLQISYIQIYAENTYY